METGTPQPSPSYLVVEDSPDVCEGIIRRMNAFSKWKALGYALSVGAALDAIRAHRPQLIFLDWQLAGGDAYTVLETVENLPGYRPYIVFFTGYQSDEPHIPERIINDYGVDKYLVKPIWEKLRAHLPEYLAAAEAKAVQAPPRSAEKVWLEDHCGVKHALDLLDLLCVVQHETLPRCRNFFFAGRPAPYCIPASWQGTTDLLEAHNIDFFTAKSRSHLVVRRYIERYDRPFVRLRGLALKFEVTAEKHTAFERWLLAEGAVASSGPQLRLSQ